MPYSLNKSSVSPVAADELNILTISNGITGDGSPIFPVNFPMKPDIISKNPDARSTPTAIMSPTSVGAIDTTVFMPSFAPVTNSS